MVRPVNQSAKSVLAQPHFDVLHVGQPLGKHCTLGPAGNRICEEALILPCSILEMTTPNHEDQRGTTSEGQLREIISEVAHCFEINEKI